MTKCQMAKMNQFTHTMMMGARLGMGGFLEVSCLRIMSNEGDMGGGGGWRGPGDMNEVNGSDVGCWKDAMWLIDVNKWSDL